MTPRNRLIGNKNIFQMVKLRLNCLFLDSLLMASVLKVSHIQSPKDGLNDSP